MPEITARDPRRQLLDTKYFLIVPRPLQQWLWQQKVPESFQRVFWEHWQAGQQAGDFCSQIAISEVARRCCLDDATVSRAYVRLRALGLLRREDAGRDPDNPFRKATAVTEVLVPRALVMELGRYPSRTSSPVTASRAPEARTQPQPAAPAPAAAPDAAAAPKAAFDPKADRAQFQALSLRMSAAEKTRYAQAFKERTSCLLFDETTQLTAPERAQLLDRLARNAGLPAHAQPRATPRPATAASGPRRLSTFEQARIRRRLDELKPAEGVDEVFRQIIWSVEEGALARFDPRYAINIACKKVADGAWTRPHQMPARWQRDLPTLPRLPTPAPRRG